MKDDEFTKSQKIVRGAAGALLAFVVLCVVAAFCAGLGGCATGTRIGTDSGSVRESSAYIFGRLEESVEGFDRGVADAIRRSQKIEDDIERLEFLFRQYEQAALRLRDEVDKVRRGKQEAGKNAQ